MTNTYDWLISRLDAFIRKYYANKVIRGALVFLSCLLFYILTASVGEYYFYLPVWARISIVSTFVLLGGSALVAWVIIPLAKMARLGKVISHDQAAAIIGTHFPEVSDRLLNILQLKRQGDGQASRELAEASINQKIKQISVVPLTSAVDFSKNRKYLPYFLPLMLAGVFILVAAPNVFKESSSRLLQPTKAFSKPAPFLFLVKNQSLTAIRNADFVLTMETKGNALPAEAYIEIGGEPVPMQPMANHTFQYTFKNVTEATNFRFAAAGFYSDANTLKVIQRPVLKSFKVQVDYPAYTGRKDEVRNSLSDMTLPAGTQVSWSIVTDHTDAATIHFGSGSPVALPKSTETFAHQYRFMNDTSYTITLHNKAAALADSYKYQVSVIPDQYPVIQLQQFRDTVSGKQIVITGTAGDDYSVTRVNFNYEVMDKNKAVATRSIPLKISAGALTPFQQYFDIQTLNLQPGQKVSYYIEAWDNDGVHGSKASRSEMMSYQMFDAKQLDSAINENSNQINSGLSNSAEKSKQLQSDYKDAASKMLQSNNMDWQQQQVLREMMNKQDALKTQLENIKQRFEEQMQQSEQKNFSEDLQEKQKELQKQMDNLLNEELKEQMKKLQELMQKLNKEQAVDAMKQMEQDNKLFSMDMERMQELMKKLEQQMHMEQMATKMDQLAQKQRDLQKATENNKKDAATLSKEQKGLKDQLEKAMKENMKEAQQLAKDTKQNDRLEDEQKQGEDAAKDMEESKENIDKKQNDKAGKKQDDAAKNLEDMAKSLRKKAASGGDQEQIEIDIRATRQILSNLIRLSFDQEELMTQVRRTSSSSQAYLNNQEEQNRLHRNSQMIRDSMFALSKRIVKLSTTINKETTQLEQYMHRAVDGLEARNIPGALTNEQYVMTHTNNLALMLNELLANLLQMQAEGKKGGDGPAGACSKPGSKPGKGKGMGAGAQLSDIISQQEKLGQGMGKMPKPGGQGQGQGQGEGQKGQGSQGKNAQGEYGDAEQLARMAQQQASIRRQLQELNNLLKSKGLGNSKEMREVEQKMDKNETDLVNRRLTNELLIRQKDITTRLLEVEKSLREQDQDDKRSSRSAQDPTRPVPPALEKYLTDQKQLLELYKTVPPQLKPYYKDMVENYFHLIGKDPQASPAINSATPQNLPQKRNP
ncbi:MAG: hypothetical protein V4649_09115 [Bacteroidota bacterium]